MSDIFREVDEDLRRERYKKLWDRYGTYVIGAAVLIVVLTAGYRGWVYWSTLQAEESGDRFVAALTLANEGKHDEAIVALEEITADGSGGYPMLARFRAAAERAAVGDTAGAVADYDAIAGDGSTPELIRQMAELRAAMILADTASLADLNERIGDLAATGGPWRHSAREILGLAAWREGDMTAARGYFNEIVNDQEAPQNIRSRAQLMLGLITAREGAAAESAEPEG